MSPPRERGPVDYEEEVTYRDKVIEKLTEAMGKQGGYHEGSSNLEKWLITLLTGLLLAGVSGTIVGYAKLSALEERTLSIQSQVNDIKRIVEPHYRGAEPSS